MNAKKTVTVGDVAALADVSIATVSRTLSQPNKVSLKKRELVMQAIEKTGYVVNEAARSLSRQQTDTIVILVPNISAFISKIVEGIEAFFAQKNIGVLIADTRKVDLSPSTARSYFSKNRVDGVIILDGLISMQTINAYQHRPPVLFAGEWNPKVDDNFPIVSVDDELGTKLAIEYLYQAGHRTFGHIAGPLSHTPGQRRYRSFCDTLTQLGHSLSQTWLFEGEFSLLSGKNAALAWLALSPSQRPSAIFCAGDEIAFGFIATLKTQGIGVPEQVSVIGYDDLEVAEYYVPALTTIHQPRYQLGQLAAQTLFNLMQGEAYIHPTPLKPHLVVRHSTKPAPDLIHH